MFPEAFADLVSRHGQSALATLSLKQNYLPRKLTCDLVSLLMHGPPFGGGGLPKNLCCSRPWLSPAARYSATRLLKAQQPTRSTLCWPGHGMRLGFRV